MLFFIEWLVLAVPPLLSMSIYANALAVLSMLLLVPTAVLLLPPPIERGTPLPTQLDESKPDRVVSDHNGSPPPSLDIASSGSIVNPSRIHDAHDSVINLGCWFSSFPLLLLNARLTECHWYHRHLKPAYPHADCPELDGTRGRIIHLFTRCHFCHTLAEGSIAFAETYFY